MTEQRRNEETVVLAYDSPSYRAHLPHIEAAKQRAEQLQLLYGDFRTAIFTSQGIVCIRPREDKIPSVSRSFYGLSTMTQDEDGMAKLEFRAQQIRALLMDVLAIHLSIAEDPQEAKGRGDPPVEVYRQFADELEELCKENDLPSLLPFLFSAASLFHQLQHEPWNDVSDPRVTEVYGQLTKLFSCVDRHFHTVVTAMQRNGMKEQALVAIRDASALRGEPLESLFAANPVLLGTYVNLLFDSGRFDEVIAVGAETAEETFSQVPQILEKLVRSLVTRERFDEVIPLLVRTADIPRLPFLAKTIGIMCVDIGWWLYGEGRHEEAVLFLERVIPDEIHSREDVRSLYQAHQEMAKTGSQNK